MPKKHLDLPISAVARVVKRAGIDRVSKDAAVALADALEQEATKIGREAAALASHAGRKTVTAEDVRLARKNVK